MLPPTGRVTHLHVQQNTLRYITVHNVRIIAASAFKLFRPLLYLVNRMNYSGRTKEEAWENPVMTADGTRHADNSHCLEDIGSVNSQAV